MTFPAGASTDDINNHMRFRMEPAGWMFDSIQKQGNEQVFCFRPIPPGGIP
jgi:hypothetical protein